MFEFIGKLFYLALYQPLFNLLIFLYNLVPGNDFGVAIILLTIIIRFIIAPLSIKAVHSQRKLQELQPKLEEIQKKYKDDRQKQGIETLNLYKAEKTNPFFGILLAFVQLPILICLYQVFWKGLDPKELTNLYSFITSPEQIHYIFLGFINLSKPNILFAIIAGAVQYLQTKMLMPKKSTPNASKGNEMAQTMQKQMTYFLPIFTVIILFNLPSALGLYWIVGGIFSIVQQYFIIKKEKNN